MVLAVEKDKDEEEDGAGNNNRAAMHTKAMHAPFLCYTSCGWPLLGVQIDWIKFTTSLVIFQLEL